MLNDIEIAAKSKMQKSIESLSKVLAKIRTGRASPSLLDGISVTYYGNPTPLNQVASIAAPEPRTLTVTPFDKSMSNEIEKAIRNSDLGLNPASHGTVIHVPLPPLTQERKLALVKQIKTEGESAKVAIRNIRRDSNQHMKNLLKDKLINNDEEKRGQEQIQKLTDKFIADIESLIGNKETDLMKV